MQIDYGYKTSNNTFSKYDANVTFESLKKSQILPLHIIEQLLNTSSDSDSFDADDSLIELDDDFKMHNSPEIQEEDEEFDNDSEEKQEVDWAMERSKGNTRKVPGMLNVAVMAICSMKQIPYTISIAPGTCVAVSRFI